MALAGKCAELRDEVRLFLMEHGTQLADHLTDPAWLTRLAYLSCIFEKLNGLNLGLQDENTIILSMNDKICAFKRKLKRWSARVKMGSLDMFSELDEFIKKCTECQYTAEVFHSAPSVPPGIL